MDVPSERVGRVGTHWNFLLFFHYFDEPIPFKEKLLSRPLPRDPEEVILYGCPICPGIAIAPPFFFIQPKEEVPEFLVPRDQIEGEVARYYQALQHSRRDLVALQKRLRAEGGGEAVAILHTHLEMMKDPMMTADVEKEIRLKGKNTEFAFHTVIGGYEKRFSKISDLFFQERVKDFRDIARRIIFHLQKKDRPSLNKIKERSIVFAHELVPSDTAEARTEQIEAFVTDAGSDTSHVAIMAREKGIPFVSKIVLPADIQNISGPVIVDGETGYVILYPRPDTLRQYKKKREQLHQKTLLLHHERLGQAISVDGVAIRVTANVEAFDPTIGPDLLGADGVGLFRSEYLFLSKGSFPTEEEQLLVYKKLVEASAGQRVVIRTFDVGGDKLGTSYPSRFETNPYLGCRATRLMLREPSVFKIQLRAILRASVFGDIQLLLPMISGVEELRCVKTLIHEVQQECASKGIAFRSPLVGCMLEVPSAVLTVDLLLQECDFVSIGTNDLVQYTLAVDRGNHAMEYLYQTTHPAILRSILRVTQEAKKQKKRVSLCGEIAADPSFVPLLLGLGIEELSVPPRSVALIKNTIRKASISQLQRWSRTILNCQDASQVELQLQLGPRSIKTRHRKQS